MKVLFAVNSENVSDSIIKKYLKDYREILSFNNVYYFNAIQKEIQKDKTYDRIVISEDLEPFSANNYESIDKFIFEKIDAISDEAHDLQGNEIPIIFICSDRRTKGSDFLVKLFSLGVYNALLGNDRSKEEVCKLINKPRTKKEGKLYYKIESDNANYKAENENEVSENEIQNILAYFKKLGKNTDKYAKCFENIASQYSDEQLKIIINCLPSKVRNVLSDESEKFQKIMSASGELIKGVKNNISKNRDDQRRTGIKMDIIETKKNTLSQPIVIPNTINPKKVKNVKKNKNLGEEKNEKKDSDSMVKVEEKVKVKNQKIDNEEESNKQKVVVKMERKNPSKSKEKTDEISENEEKHKKKKKKTKTNNENEKLLRKYSDLDLDDLDLPDIDDFDDFDDNKGINETEELLNMSIDDEEDFDIDIDEDIDNEEKALESKINYSMSSLSSLMTKDKKIVSFLGTSKNGVSFLVNNLAEVFSSVGINTAILDMTKNKNSYYIYTKNEETLRKVAYTSIEKLQSGIAEGIKVKNNITVYTTVPNDGKDYSNVEGILSTLVQNHSLVLIDCDFDTPASYFANSQEIYLIQSMDILTIQPLTAFLRELKLQNILETEKVKVVINKEFKIKGLTSKVIVNGMSTYNDPAMSFMTDLFNKDIVRYCSIPFDESVYAKYMEGVLNNKISLSGYSKNFMAKLKTLAEMVYPLTSRQTYSPNSTINYEKKTNNSFSSNTNSTLNKMKRKI